MRRLLPLLIALSLAAPAEAFNLPTKQDLKHYSKVAYKWAKNVFVPIMLVTVNVLLATRKS